MHPAQTTLAEAAVTLRVCSGAVDARSVDIPPRDFVAIDYFERIKLPFVVAVNQFAGRPNLGVADVRTATDVDPDVPVVTVDARDRESMKALVLTLLDVLLHRAGSRRHSVSG